MSKSAEKSAEINKARAWMPEGSTVYTILRTVSRTGMSRTISVVVMLDNDPIHPNYTVSKIIGNRLISSGGHDAIRVNGCGMDMGFDLVYRLSYALYGRGDALKQRWL